MTVKVGDTGWLSPWAYCEEVDHPVTTLRLSLLSVAHKCIVLAIDGDRLMVQLEDGREGWVAGNRFTPVYMYQGPGEN